MSAEATIPILPCRSIDETLAFYVAVGFEVTYRQERPNNYAVVRRGGIELHFFSMKAYDPAQSYSTCYVRVPDVDGIYQEFTAGLRRAYGRVPAAGIPRIIPLKNKAHDTREFIAVDPGGNWIRIGQKVQGGAVGKSDAVPKGASKLFKAVHAVALLDHAGQYETAAERLDAALAADEPAPAADRVRALVLRAGLAITAGDLERARAILGEVPKVSLSPDDRIALADELRRADEFADQIG